MFRGDRHFEDEYIDEGSAGGEELRRRRLSTRGKTKTISYDPEKILLHARKIIWACQIMNISFITPTMHMHQFVLDSIQYQETASRSQSNSCAAHFSPASKPCIGTSPRMISVIPVTFIFHSTDCVSAFPTQINNSLAWLAPSSFLEREGVQVAQPIMPCLMI